MAIDLMEMIKGAVSQQVMGKLGGALGMEPKKASSAFDIAAGAVLGGLMKKASTPQGAKAVFDAAKNQDSSVLDKLGDLMGSGQASDQFQKSGGGILDMVLGGSKSGILAALAKAIGVDQNMISKLLAMVAPIVMSIIGRQVKAKALDAAGLGGLLGDQKQALSKYMPASLTSSLGFGDLLGNASQAVSGAASSAKQMGNSASKAANEAAAQGGGLLKILIPLALLALGGWAVWKFVINKPGAAEVLPAIGQLELKKLPKLPSVELPEFDLGNLDFSGMGEAGTTLKNGFGEITSGLTDLKDEGGANQLVEKITGFTGKLDGLGLDKLDGLAKTASTTIIGKCVDAIKGLLVNVPAPLKAIIQPAIDSLMEKLKPFVG